MEFDDWEGSASRSITRRRHPVVGVNGVQVGVRRRGFARCMYNLAEGE